MSDVDTTTTEAPVEKTTKFDQAGAVDAAAEVFSGMVDVKDDAVVIEDEKKTVESAYKAVGLDAKVEADVFNRKQAIIAGLTRAVGNAGNMAVENGTIKKDQTITTGNLKLPANSTLTISYTGSKTARNPQSGENIEVKGSVSVNVGSKIVKGVVAKERSAIQARAAELKAFLD